ncbi:MAG: laminin G domain-containing protein, partial [Fibrobacteres bacterium]|nr:laminin G domain-containing protein [Fibrobacterota bacterium]
MKIMKVLAVASCIYSSIYAGQAARWEFNTQDIYPDFAVNNNTGYAIGDVERVEGILNLDIANNTNYAAKFNGNPSSNKGIGRVNVANSPSLKLQQDMTFSSWIKFDKLNNDYQIFVEKGKDRVNIDYDFSLTSSKRLRFSYVPSNELWWHVVEDPSGWTPVTDRWYLISIVVSKTNSKVSFYVDGMMNSTVNATLSHKSSDFPLYIGRTAVENSYVAPFYGTMDNLTIYNHALTGTEIENIYQATMQNRIVSQYYFPVNRAYLVDRKSFSNPVLVGNFTQNGTEWIPFQQSTGGYLLAQSSRAIEISGSMTFSVSMILYAQSTPKYRIILEKGKDRVNIDYDFAVTPSGKLRFAYVPSNAFFWHTIEDNSNFIVRPGENHRYTFVVNKQLGTVSFYVDYMLLSTVADPYGLAYLPSNHPLYLGRTNIGNTSNPGYLDGELNSPIIYNFALSDAEAKDRYFICRKIKAPELDSDSLSLNNELSV